MQYKPFLKPNLLLEKIGQVTESKKYKAICQQIYLAHYVFLSMYAVGNLYLLFYGALLCTPWVALLAAVLCISCAMVNEIINMKTITNPDTGASELVEMSGNSGAYSFFGAIAWLFLLVDTVISSTSMINIQLQIFKKTKINIKPMALGIYKGLLVITAVISRGMTSATNWVCFLSLRFGIKTTEHNKNRGKNKDHGRSESMFNNYLAWYIKNSITLSFGLFIGGFLYAYGDYQQVTGVLFLLQVAKVITVSPQLIVFVGLSVASITFAERIVIWGYNFRRFALENEQLFAQKDYLFKKIPKEAGLRSALIKCRLAVTGFRNIASVFSMFSGVYRLFGIFTSYAYLSTCYVQSTFQMQKTKADDLGDSKRKAKNNGPDRTGGKPEEAGIFLKSIKINRLIFR